MPIPDYQAFMLPVLQKAQAGEVKIGEVIKQIVDESDLTDAEKEALIPSGTTTVAANRIHWAKTYLAQAGLIQATRRAHFVITDRGREVLSRNPEKIDNSLLNEFDEFKSFKSRRNEQDEGVGTAPEANVALSDEQTPDEQLRAAHDRLDSSLRLELLERIRASDPSFFERLVVGLLVEMGYGGSAAEAGRALGRSSDGGVDGVIDQDPLGLDRVYVQAKRYADGNNVGAGSIRDFFGSLDRFKASKGLFVTTSKFTTEATATADMLSKRIVLIDGAGLTRLMIRYNVGCQIQETLHIRRISEDFFED